MGLTNLYELLGPNVILLFLTYVNHKLHGLPGGGYTHKLERGYMFSVTTLYVYICLEMLPKHRELYIIQL